VLLTNDLPELAELGFIDGETCMTYVDTDELLDKLNLAMANPDLRNAIGRRGLALVNERHTYAHRAEQVLAQVGRASHGGPVNTDLPMNPGLVRFLYSGPKSEVIVDKNGNVIPLDKVQVRLKPRGIVE